MLTLILLYVASVCLATLLLLVFFAFPQYATHFTANLAIAELIMLALQTLLLATVFLLT